MLESVFLGEIFSIPSIFTVKSTSNPSVWLFFSDPTKTFPKNWWFRSKISLWFQSLILGVRLPSIFQQGTESTVLVNTVIINRWIHLLAPLTKIFFYHWLYWELQDLTTLQKFWNCQVEMWFFAFGNFRKFATKIFFVMYLRQKNNSGADWKVNFDFSAAKLV